MRASQFAPIQAVAGSWTSSAPIFSRAAAAHHASRVCKRTRLRELLVPHAQALIEKTVEFAQSGDTTVLRLCLEQIIGPIRTKDEAAVIEQAGNTLADRVQPIVNAGITVQVRPNEAATLLKP